MVELPSIVIDLVQFSHKILSMNERARSPCVAYLNYDLTEQE